MLFLAGLLLVLAWDLAGEPQRPWPLTAMTQPITAVDLNQHRLNSVPPTPQGGWRLQQQFTPRHNGLSQIELILARNNQPDANENGRLSLQLYDDAHTLIAERTLFSRNFAHNHVYTFTFPAQKQSAHRPYILEIGGNDSNPLTVWAYDLPIYADSQFQLVAEAGQPETSSSVQTLRFVTHYQLTAVDAAQEWLSQLQQNGRLLVVALLFLFLPGAWLLYLRPWPSHSRDPIAQLGWALALSTAVWPLLWYGVTLLGGRWSGPLLWILLIGGWGGLLLLNWLKPRSVWSRPSAIHLAFLLLWLVGLAARLLAVRDLAAPPWVDASRHALITAVMADNGRTISQYAPYLPIDQFPYHFGFHALSASLLLLTQAPLEQLLLFLGQLLNSLLPLTVYTAVWLVCRRRPAALIAAFLLALPFFFPAYYATWGRFTQLTAVLIMPPLLAASWLLLRGAKRWRNGWVWVAVLAAGLFLIHFRVFLFYLPFAGLVWAISRGRHGRWLLAAGLAGLGLVLPRLLYLWRTAKPVETLSHSIQNYNNFPTDYYTAGWDRFFIWLAWAMLWLSLLLLLSRRSSWRWFSWPLTLLLWVALVMGLLGGDYVGLPTTSLVNLNSFYITLFLPLAIFLGVTLDRFWQALARTHWAWLAAGYVAAGVLTTAVALFGWQQQINILNPATILLQSPDLPALAWLAENVTAEAKIGVNSWKWLGNTWAGNDGGAWIVPLTQRQSSTPPADYIYDQTLYEQVTAFNEAATAVDDWAAPETAVWLRQQGIDYLFVGARGGFLDPYALAQNPQLQLVYGRDGAFVFAVLP